MPVGLIDPDEDPAAAAAREFEEETGYSGEVVDVLPTWYLSPGLMNESVSLLQMEVDMPINCNIQIHNNWTIPSD